MISASHSKKFSSDLGPSIDQQIFSELKDDGTHSPATIPSGELSVSSTEQYIWTVCMGHIRCV